MKKKKEAQVIEILEGYSWCLDSLVDELLKVDMSFISSLQLFVNDVINSMTVGFCEDFNNTLYIYTHDGNVKINYCIENDVLVLKSVFLYIIK